MRIPNTLSKFSYMIEEISDERRYGDGIWVYLKPGLTWDGVHMVHEDTLKECAMQLLNVVKCNCAHCRMRAK